MNKGWIAVEWSFMKSSCQNDVIYSSIKKKGFLVSNKVLSKSKTLVELESLCCKKEMAESIFLTNSSNSKEDNKN